MTLQEADEDRRVARRAMRGILIAASNLHATGSVDLATRAEKVAVVAATHAASVDAESRFPKEAIDAARAERLLSAAVPPDLGGEGGPDPVEVDVVGCAHRVPPPSAVRSRRRARFRVGRGRVRIECLAREVVALN